MFSTACGIAIFLVLKYCKTSKQQLNYPEMILFAVDLYFAGIHFSFFCCKIPKLRQPIAMKFCTVLGSLFDFIIPVQNLEGLYPKKN